MNWIEIAAILALLIGIGLGGYFIAPQPAFWLGLLTSAVKAALPVILKRMPEDKEREFRDCVRRGGEWDHIRKRCKR